MLSPSADTKGAPATSGHSVLLCQVGSLICGLPLEHVSETMRPLPLEPLAGTASFVDGVSIIRGIPVPIVDLARLLGSGTDEARGRLVVVKLGERRAALSVAAVIGVRSIAAASVGAMPPLLSGANADLVTAVGALDAQLLLILETSRVLPSSSWASPEGGAEA